MNAAAKQRAPWYRSFRFWVSVVTAVLVGLIVWAAWPNILDAVDRLADVNPWILLLLVPVQLASYAITGEVLFSYLRARGEMRGMHALTAMRMSLEFNFANHMLPSAGAAGIAYTSWRLNTLGVSASRATLAQLVRFAVTFVSFILLLTFAVVSLIVQGNGAGAVLWTALIVGILAIAVIVVGSLLLRRRRMLHRFAGRIAGFVGWVFRLIRKPAPIDAVGMVRFFDGLHIEFRDMLAAPRALLAPFLWSFLINILDAGLYWVALAAFGVMADPALLFVAYGLAAVASMVIATPNGVGGYEVALVGTLVAGGMDGGTTIAAIVVARVILLLGTIVFGWAFYQHSVLTASAPRLKDAARID